MSVIETARGRIVDYDERAGEMIVRVPYTNIPRMMTREYKEVEVTLLDSRPLSAKQRRSCYAMIREIAEWSGDDASSVKGILKLSFWKDELYQTADTLFSLSNAPMSIVSEFQKWLARFIVRNDIPTRKSLLEYVDDVPDYIYACLISKKCVICGRKADLHHVDRVGMGRDRDDIIHEGMLALPLCREHHDEAHTMPDSEFIEKYHLTDGIEIDKTICRIYGLKARKKKDVEQGDPARAHR